MTNRATRRRMASQKTPSGRKLTPVERKMYCKYLKVTQGFIEPRRAPIIKHREWDSHYPSQAIKEDDNE